MIHAERKGSSGETGNLENSGAFHWGWGLVFLIGIPYCWVLYVQQVWETGPGGLAGIALGALLLCAERIKSV